MQYIDLCIAIHVKLEQCRKAQRLNCLTQSTKSILIFLLIAVLLRDCMRLVFHIFYASNLITKFTSLFTQNQIKYLICLFLSITKLANIYSFSYIWRPPSLSELIPIIFNTGLNHLSFIWFKIVILLASVEEMIVLL